MSHYFEQAEMSTLPVIVLREMVAFPAVTISFEINDKISLAAANSAIENNTPVLLATLKDPMAGIKNGVPDTGMLYKIATVARIRQSLKTPEGQLRVICEGTKRASVSDYLTGEDGFIVANAMSKTISVAENGGLRGEACMRAAVASVEKMLEVVGTNAQEILLAVKSIKDVGLLADFIASNILVKCIDKQTILECFEPLSRIETLLVLLKHEYEILSYESDIQKKVRARMQNNQRDYYLREQMNVIKDELGDNGDAEIDEYTEKIASAKLPDAVREKLQKEVDRMAKTPFGSSEATVIRSYLDSVLELPWGKYTKDRLDIAVAEKILDDDHDGLEKVKERVIEYLAVKQLNPEIGNQIICLVGPPGTGKTSVASSIARAMKRKFVRVSLGGVRDEADIRGHRKTYIGAMPGRIMTALAQAGSSNPLILLDEIDKLTSDAHGDPASALLEVLDSEQNKAFRDHFIELPYDLSGCMFIATANTLSTVPKPLIDRMEVIEMHTYTKREKLGIAKNHLIPKQLKRHGLSKKTLKISDGVINSIIDFYTAEAGVRNLERNIADICRKTAKKIVDGSITKAVITEKNIAEYLGSEKMKPLHISDSDEVGEVNGLAYTEAGGDMLKVEVAVLDGTGKTELTGSLGDVMKESAMAAISYARMVAEEYGIDKEFYKNKDIHIHVPEGAVPKDGPSAGVTLATALISALSGIPVRRDIAMTGEITLRGKVLAIGGLREKTMAAYSAGVKEVLIPADNMSDLENIDPLARDNMIFTPCKTLSDVLGEALCKKSLPLSSDSKLIIEEKDLKDDSVVIPPEIKESRIPQTARNK